MEKFKINVIAKTPMTIHLDLKEVNELLETGEITVMTAIPKPSEIYVPEDTLKDHTISIKINLFTNDRNYEADFVNLINSIKEEINTKGYVSILHVDHMLKMHNGDWGYNYAQALKQYIPFVMQDYGWKDSEDISMLLSRYHDEAILLFKPPYQIIQE